ncbi:MAG: hypothetical protein JRG91_02455 [Deltaproteobacteria bacterium]|nr:hypothetical protein [Deltaproteobacteria bacterium]
MSRPARTRLVRVLTAAACIGLFVVLAAPLPGEMRGCGGDASGSVNKSDYCRDKCDIEAQKVRLCELIDDTDEAEADVYNECIRARQCQDPPMCMTVPDYHISNEEADACFTAITRVACGSITVDGLDYDYDTPAACEDICDPI